MRFAPNINALLRLAAGFASGKDRKAALVVLTCHRVLEAPDPLLPDEPDAAQFAAWSDALAQTFNVLSLAEALALRKEGRLPPRALCITFDDGYANNAEIALPILLSRGLKATFFVATGFVGNGLMWNDSVIEAVRCAQDVLDLSDLNLGAFPLDDVEQRRLAIQHILSKLKYREPTERVRIAQAIAAHAKLPRSSPLMMNQDQVRALAEHGMDIGAHTVSHPILTRIDAEAARHEITASGKHLRDITGRFPSCFAYPNGRPGTDYGREHAEMVRSAGYENAVSTAWGCVTADSDPYQLPRIAPWGATQLSRQLRVIRAYRQRAAEVA